MKRYIVAFDNGRLTTAYGESAQDVARCFIYANVYLYSSPGAENVIRYHLEDCDPANPTPNGLITKWLPGVLC